MRIVAGAGTNPCTLHSKYVGSTQPCGFNVIPRNVFDSISDREQQIRVWLAQNRSYAAWDPTLSIGGVSLSVGMNDFTATTSTTLEIARTYAPLATPYVAFRDITQKYMACEVLLLPYA